MREAEHDQAPSGHHPAAKIIRPRRYPKSRWRPIRLQQYWHDQGYPAARFWTEPLDERFTKIGTYEVYQLKCKLVNRPPPRYRGETE